MADYVVLQASDDSDAPENIATLQSFAEADEHVDFGLDVTNVSWSGGTFDLTEGKVFGVLDTALAEWTDDSGTSHSLTVHNAVITAHYDARTGIAFDTGASVNYVFADINYTTSDSPLVAVNATGEPPGDDAVEIAQLDTGAQMVEPRNQHPSGEFDSLTAHTEIVDPAGVSHTGEIADASDVPTAAEINQAVNQNASHGSDAPHDYLPEGHTNPTYDSDASGVVDDAESAQSVAGGNVSGAVAEADHAATADTADAVGGVGPANFLRTDTTDRLHADVNANGQRIENLDGLTFSDSSVAAINLSDSPDGDRVVVAHEDHQWESRSGSGEPFAVRGETGGGVGDIIAVDGGNFYVHRGDVFTEDGRLASQQWTNDNFHRSGSVLDLAGETLSGVGNVQPEGGTIDIYGRTNVRDDLEERGDRVATRQWTLSNLPLAGHNHDNIYYRQGQTYSTGQANNRFAATGHDHDGRYYRQGQTYSTGQADSQFASSGHNHNNDTINPDQITSSAGVLSMPVQIQGINGILFGDGGFLHQEDSTGRLVFQYDGGAYYLTE